MATHTGKSTPRHIKLTELTYRHIAKMLVQALPIDADDMTERVNDYTTIIKSLPASARYALRAAYIFGSKAPREEREDLFQELALKALTARADSEKLAYAIARADWLDWWKNYKRNRGFITVSLESTTMDEDGNQVTLGSMLAGECDFELKMDGELDGERIFDMLPDNLKRIVERRLTGQIVSPFDHQALTDWASRHPMILA
jgi:hypothetical protein